MGPAARQARGSLPNLKSAPRPVRHATWAGLILAGCAAVALGATVLRGGAADLTNDTERSILLYGFLIVSAFVAVAAGLALVAAVSALPTSPRPRATFVATSGTALLVTSTSLIASPYPGGEGAAYMTTLDTLLVTVPGWLGLATLLAVVVVTGGHGVGSPVGRGAAVLTPFVGVLMGGIAMWALTGVPLYGVNLLFNALLILAFPALVLPAAVLLWLAVEGLVGSREAATRMLRRAPSAGALLTGLLGVKAAVIAVTAVLLAVDKAPSIVMQLRPGVSGFLVAVPLVCLVMGMLANERSVARAERHLYLAARSTAFLLLGALAPVALIGPAEVALKGLGRPPVAAGLLLLALFAICVAIRGRHWPPRVVLLVGGAVALIAAVLPTSEALGAAGGATSVSTSDGLSVPVLATILAVSLLSTAVALVVWLGRPGVRAIVPFAVALVLWTTVTFALPKLTGQVATPVAFDIVLTTGIAAAALAWRAGRQRWATPHELLLLLVIATTIVELPVLLSLLPQGTAPWLVLAAFLLPAFARLGSLDATATNAVPRVLGTVAAMSLGYGMLTVLAVAVAEAIGLVYGIVDLVNGLVAMPFAVLLAAAAGTAPEDSTTPASAASVVSSPTVVPPRPTLDEVS